MVSLTTLMCEFDTLSESGEVLADVYDGILHNFNQITEARKGG
jgi:hypothetical protein